MIEELRFQWALRRHMKDHRVLKQNYESMPPDPEEPGDKPRYKYAVGREMDYQTQAIDNFRSKYLVEQAYRLHVPLPYEEDSWIQPRGAPEAYLTPEAAHKLRAEIRTEQKANWEFWQGRVTLTLGLIGSIFGVLAYFKK
ncbi:hypothetical protein [Bradyrhizobium sp. 150]|uniref:hypothetical protein n=1 Tax=Bradyrhizobium sp. 150 TaxID=2782625 RepID=UPI001FF71601|nr:hypothetical protein [Bradyrhizobium sp. 150]MCK1672687.1 hypothetical protein [Bradyrhizobium sp. 150]